MRLHKLTISADSSESPTPLRSVKFLCVGVLTPFV